MSDHDAAVTAWEHTARSLVALGRDCDADDFAVPTECPGWDVQDQFSHVLGVERWLLGGTDPDHDLPDYPHLRHDFGRRVEVAVDIRRQLPGAEVVEELADVVEARSRDLRGGAADPDHVVEGPFGPVSLRDLLALRTFDVWSHEQDVRRALQRPGGLGSPAAAVSVAGVRRMLGRVVARDAAAPVGSTVVVRVTGPVSFTQAVEVVDGDGRARGTVLDGVPDDPDVRLDLDTEAFTRRAAGRWPVATTPVQVTGDAELAERVLEALAVTP